MVQPPEHVKERILLFFLETSVPRLIEENRKSNKKEIYNDQGNATNIRRLSKTI